jgi:divinyl protochlorophyllide a 8-vinyl-reductase
MHAADALAAGRIGPNAITRLAEALAVHGGPALTAQVFARAGLARYLADPPEAMVDEAEVAQLHRVLADAVARSESVAIARDAGRRTAEYLLARRIPKPAQWLLRHLPRRMAAAILVHAIAAHAWTFAGSGSFAHSFDAAQPGVLWLTITNSPLCRHPDTPAPACDYFAATFAGVFAAMLGEGVRVVETECAAGGAPACRFRVSWAG